MKILVVQQKMIGDVLISSILCEHIKEHLPKAEVHYLVNTHTQAVVEGNRSIDRIVLFEPAYKSNKLELLKFLRQISKAEYDVVIDVYGKLESNLISLFSGAKKRISYRKWYSKFIYTHLISRLPETESSAGLAIENRMLLLQPLLPNIMEKEKKRPRIYLNHLEISKARLFLSDNGIAQNRPIIMLSTLGSAENKTYPLSEMAKVIDHIADNTSAVLLFNYIPSQLAEVRQLYSLCSQTTKDKIALDVFAPTLRDFLGILAHCDAVIGNEGGMMNMAKALNVPTFSIFSPWVSKTAWHTFNTDTYNTAVHLNDYLPEKIHGKSKKTLQHETPELYQLFDSEYFIEDLDYFLKGFIGKKTLADE